MAACSSPRASRGGGDRRTRSRTGSRDAMLLETSSLSKGTIGPDTRDVAHLPSGEQSSPATEVHRSDRRSLWMR